MSGERERSRPKKGERAARTADKKGEPLKFRDLGDKLGVFPPNQPSPAYWFTLGENDVIRLRDACNQWLRKQQHKTESEENDG